MKYKLALLITVLLSSGCAGTGSQVISDVQKIKKNIQDTNRYQRRSLDKAIERIEAHEFELHGMIQDGVCDCRSYGVGGKGEKGR